MLETAVLAPAVVSSTPSINLSSASAKPSTAPAFFSMPGIDVPA
jgi:hypothetical protein